MMQIFFKEFSQLKLERIDYDACGGKEVFLSFNDNDLILYLQI